MKDDIDILRDENDKLEEENKKLKECLEWYGDENNFNGSQDLIYCPIGQDDGQKARDLLKEIKKNSYII